MKKMYLVTIMSLIFLGSCTSMSEPDRTTMQEVEIDNPNFISVEEAMHNADRHFSEVFGPQTRAAREVKDVEVFRSLNATRSNDGDEMFGFYIVNYENNGGFAMLSADRRRQEVYAISNEGSLHLADTLSNKGLSWYINEHINNIESNSVGLTPPVVIPKDTTIHGFTGTKNIKMRATETLLSPIVRKIDQWWPYNAFCVKSNGDMAAVGCLPLATGLIMSNYRSPKTVDDYTLNWDAMLSEKGQEGWAYLFEMLGRPEYLSANYDADNGTECSSWGIERTFEQLGFDIPKYSNNFKTNIAYNELWSGYPIMCIGFENYKNQRYGHTWVIDGSYQMWTMHYLDGLVLSEHEISYYYHCIWGDALNTSGYYLYGNSLGGEAAEYDIFTRNEEPVYEDLSFFYNFRLKD